MSNPLPISKNRTFEEDVVAQIRLVIAALDPTLYYAPADQLLPDGSPRPLRAINVQRLRPKLDAEGLLVLGSDDQCHVYLTEEPADSRTGPVGKSMLVSADFTTDIYCGNMEGWAERDAWAYFWVDIIHDCLDGWKLGGKGWMQTLSHTTIIYDIVYGTGKKPYTLASIQWRAMRRR